MGTMQQGQVSTWVVSAGRHEVKLKYSGIGGMFRRMGGSDEAFSCNITIGPGVTTRYEIGYKLQKCASRHREVLFFEEAKE